MEEGCREDGTRENVLNILPQHFERGAGQDAAAVEQTDDYS